METKLESFREQAEKDRPKTPEKAPPRNVSLLQAIVKLSHRRSLSQASVIDSGGIGTPTMDKSSRRYACVCVRVWMRFCYAPAHACVCVRALFIPRKQFCSPFAHLCTYGICSASAYARASLVPS